MDAGFDPLSGIDGDYLLERESRLSESILWTLQRQYYIDTPESFSSGAVPTFATTNAFIARSYARLIHSFAIDCAGEVPVTVLELGHGRFGFLCLIPLLERMRRLGVVVPIRYVLSDFTRHSLDASPPHRSPACGRHSGHRLLRCRAAPGVDPSHQRRAH